MDRRDFLKKAGFATAAGIMIGGKGMSAASYKRIIGANDRVNVGIIGYSDRFKGSLLPAFQANCAKQNFDIVGVSDLWRLRREEAKATLEARLGHKVKTYLNNDQLYENKPCLDENSAKCRNCLNWRVLAIGETVNWGHRGDSPHFFKGR